MSTISLSLPADGTTIDAADVNTPFNTIAAVINGNLDDTNIVSGANINGSKLLAASVPGAKFDATTYGGWIASVLPAFSSATNNGGGFYDVTFASTVASYLTPGMFLRLSRTVAAPTQCTSLNGTTQYYSKSSPAGMTFTDDFVVSAWIKISAYPAATMDVVSRFNGSSGWQFEILTTGQVRLVGRNTLAANFSLIDSYQSIPINKWVHVTAQLDMSAFTASTTTSYIMIDGVDVPASVSRSGTNPTALIQAGNLEIGGTNGGTQPFAGKIAQVAIYSAKVTQASIRATMSQTLSGSETSLISAYSFNNTINDLNTTNANNLTANGSAVATSADSPFALDANRTPGGTYEWAEVLSVSTTVASVRTPEGSAIPTSGGVSAVDLSAAAKPFGFPGISNVLGEALVMTSATTTSASATQFNGLTATVTVPTGARRIRVTAFSPSNSNSAANNFVLSVWDGTVGSGTLLENYSMYMTTSGTGNAGYVSRVIPATSGSKTYNVGINTSGGTLTMTNSTTAPAYLVVELV